MTIDSGDRDYRLLDMAYDYLRFVQGEIKDVDDDPEGVKESILMAISEPIKVLEERLKQTEADSMGTIEGGETVRVVSMENTRGLFDVEPDERNDVGIGHEFVVDDIDNDGLCSSDKPGAWLWHIKDLELVEKADETEDEPDYDYQKMIDYLYRIGNEFISASEKFGKFTSYHEGKAVIGEEFEELWDEIKGEQDPENMKDEAIQVAAMALRFLHDFENMTGDKEAYANTNQQRECD